MGRTIFNESADAICKIDIAEYEAEIERRRQIGLTIDPATAETMFDWVDENDPYGVLEEQYQSKVLRREYFAVHPDGTRVHFHDLPKATRKALWARDERLMDLADHDAEVERRRQIGLTINPFTAEMTTWQTDSSVPYNILDEKDPVEEEFTRHYFARHPGGITWVRFSDLPKKNRDIFWTIFANKCHASAKCALAGPDLEKYEAEIERRRQIGLTIDPAIAETTYWFSDTNDPYCILNEKYHGDYYWGNTCAQSWGRVGSHPRRTR